MAIELTPEQLSKLIADTVTATLQATPVNSPLPAVPVAQGANWHAVYHPQGRIVDIGTQFAACDIIDCSSTKTPERPTLDQDLDEVQWQSFLEEWDQYKRMARVQENRISVELMLCCSQELRRSLFDLINAEDITDLTESVTMETLKSVAVKNLAKHRQVFYRMIQFPDEELKNFVSRLKVEASRCEFSQMCASVQCGHLLVDYSEAQITDQMVMGLHDKQIQDEVLLRDRTLNTFHEKFAFIERLENERKTKSDAPAKNAFKSSLFLNIETTTKSKQKHSDPENEY